MCIEIGATGNCYVSDVLSQDLFLASILYCTLASSIRRTSGQLCDLLLPTSSIFCRRCGGCSGRLEDEFVVRDHCLLLKDAFRGSFDDSMRYVQELCGREPSQETTRTRPSRRWIDLVYPRDMSCPARAPSSFRARTCSGAENRATTVRHKPFRCLDNRPSSLFDSDRALGSSFQIGEECAQTFLVAETGQWRKRRPTCLCRHHDCPGVAQQRCTAYLVVKLQRMSTGLERFWDTRTGMELRMGVQTTNAKNGFQLAASAGAALQKHFKTASGGKESDMIVLRGCVSGLGCRRGSFLWVPTFRPVCAVDYVVTQY